MAEIVLGMGASHGPLLSTPPEQWVLRANDDRKNPALWYRGKSYNYDSLLAERAPGFDAHCAEEERRERHSRCRRAIDALTEKFRETAPEVLVILGNDQRELFGDGVAPAITVYRGEEIPNRQHIQADKPGLNIAEFGNAPEEGATYRGAPELAAHILDNLRGTFDLTDVSTIPEGANRKGIPHAYGFIYHSVLRGTPPPSVPVILNVHAPDVKTEAAACLEFGRALQSSIRSFNGCKTVGLVASGGLSHFVIDEDLDQGIMDAMRSGDEAPLRDIPETMFKAGTAEIKNWLPVIAAMNAEGRAFHAVDYVPCYRSEAGTGNAMAFAYWE
jgi:hypothetical protein